MMIILRRKLFAEGDDKKKSPLVTKGDVALGVGTMGSALGVGHYLKNKETGKIKTNYKNQLEEATSKLNKRKAESIGYSKIDLERLKINHLNNIKELGKEMPENLEFAKKNAERKFYRNRGTDLANYKEQVHKVAYSPEVKDLRAKLKSGAITKEQFKDQIKGKYNRVQLSRDNIHTKLKTDYSKENLEKLTQKAKDKAHADFKSELRKAEDLFERNKTKKQNQILEEGKLWDEQISKKTKELGNAESKAIKTARGKIGRNALGIGLAATTLGLGAKKIIDSKKNADRKG